MNVAIAAMVFPIIFLGELPDKTMFASLVMSTRGRPGAVWLGAAAAFVVHVAIAVTVGLALLQIVSHRILELVVASMFLGGAGLAVREGTHQREGEERHDALVAKRGPPRTSSPRAVATAFVVIFLAEWGDLTQILTANLAARYHSPLSVGAGSLLALWVVAAIAVAGGRGLLKHLNMATVRFATAVVLAVLAAYSFSRAT